MDYNKRPYFYGTGRRKKSVARVRLYNGTGKVTIKKNSKMKKGTYKAKVKVKALGNTNYKASGTKTVTFKAKVK